MDWFRTQTSSLVPDADETPLALAAAPGGEAFAPWLAEQPDEFQVLAQANGLRGRLGQTLVSVETGQAAFGIGEAPVDPLIWGAASASLPSGLYRIEPQPDDGDMAALGWLLGDYAFDRYASARGAAGKLLAPAGVDIRRIERIAEGVRLARDLINTPANDLGPAELADAAAAVAERHGASFTAVEGADLEEGFPLIEAVGRASPRAPRLIDIRWGDADKPKVTLVGKGVCFDSGGLNIKTGDYMSLMKKDMGGAANVLALAHMIMDAGLPVRLRVLVPAVENAVSGTAFRPGDVLSSRKGITVEIGNTDAEGRLILADALTLACEESPDLLIDMATLTGAARVALGPDLPPFYTGDDGLAAEIAAAGAAVADPTWRLPLWSNYIPNLDSSIADTNHISNGPMAGSITAALFLQKFVDAPERWAHFDIYGWTPKARPGRPRGGADQAARALFELLERRYGG
ncbi:MAG: leucyl aminopeptidase family protein [Pseudomonadota bacterium]